MNSWMEKTYHPQAAKTEAAALRQGIADVDWDTVERQAALTPSWKRSTKQLRKRWPRPERDGSTFHLRGARRCRQTNAPPKNPGGASRWLVTSTTPTLFSQRAKPSPLWLMTFCQRPIGQGTTRISRPKCPEGSETAPRVSPSRPARRTGGVQVEGTTRCYALVRHRAG